MDKIVYEYDKKTFSAIGIRCIIKSFIRSTRNARVCNARSGKVGSSHCYLDRRQLLEIATFDEIVMTKTFSTIDCIIKSNF